MSVIFVKKEEVKRFDMTKKPKHNYFVYYIAYFLLVPIFVLTRKIKINKKNFEGLKAPYLALMNHTSMVDFRSCVLVNKPFRKINNVISVETCYSYNEWIVRGIGAIPKRRFTNDLTLLKNMRYACHKQGNIFALYF